MYHNNNKNHQPREVVIALLVFIKLYLFIYVLHYYTQMMEEVPYTTHDYSTHTAIVTRK